MEATPRDPNAPIKIESARTPHGICDLFRRGPDYVMVGGESGSPHILAVAETSRERLDAHWKGYLDNNGGRLSIEPAAWSDIQGRLRRNTAEARADAEAVLRASKGRAESDPNWLPATSVVRAREAELIATGGPHEDRLGDPEFVHVSKLTYRQVKEFVARAQVRGATWAGIQGGFDLVHNPFDTSDDGYEPQVSEWAVNLCVTFGAPGEV